MNRRLCGQALVGFVVSDFVIVIDRTLDYVKSALRKIVDGTQLVENEGQY